jgi:hypothetical protein
MGRAREGGITPERMGVAPIAEAVAEHDQGLQRHGRVGRTGWSEPILVATASRQSQGSLNALASDAETRLTGPLFANLKATPRHGAPKPR